MMRFLVVGVWAALTITDIGFVCQYSRGVPFADECESVPYVTGAASPSVKWLFDTHNEHRIPLPKIAMIGLDRLAGGDYRACAFANVALLSAAALALVLSAGAARGFFRLADIIFPIVLLSWAHWENLTNGWQIQYTLAIAFFCGVLAALHGGAITPSRRRTIAAIIGLVGLPLCGANGILYAVPLSFWAITRTSWPLRSAALATVALAVAMMPGRGAHADVVTEPPTPFRCAVHATALLGTTLGPPFVPASFVPGSAKWQIEWLVMPEDSMPKDHPRGTLLRVWFLWSMLAIVVLYWTARVIAGRPTGWYGYAVALGAILLTALTIGWARMPPFAVFYWGPEARGALSVRYTLLLSPFLVIAYLAADRRGRKAGFILAALAILSWAAYVPAALDGVRQRAAMLDSFAAAVNSEQPAIEVAGQFTIAQHFVDREAQLAYWIALLRGLHPAGGLTADTRNPESAGNSDSGSK